MVEPTETESKETLDEAIEVFRRLYETAKNGSTVSARGASSYGCSPFG